MPKRRRTCTSSVPVSPASPASLVADALGGAVGAVARARGSGAGEACGGRVMTVFDLPDAVIEVIFDLLAGGGERAFPAKAAVVNFALSCRRFAELYRRSYVAVVKFNVVCRFTQAARVYHEAVSDALLRFTRADTVVVENCCGLFDQFDLEFRGCDCVDGFYPPPPLSTQGPDFGKLAWAARRSIPKAVVGGMETHHIVRLRIEIGELLRDRKIPVETRANIAVN